MSDSSRYGGGGTGGPIFSLAANFLSGRKMAFLWLSLWLWKATHTIAWSRTWQWESWIVPHFCMEGALCCQERGGDGRLGRQKWKKKEKNVSWQKAREANFSKQGKLIFYFEWSASGQLPAPIFYHKIFMKFPTSMSGIWGKWGEGMVIYILVDSGHRQGNR